MQLFKLKLLISHRFNWCSEAISLVELIYADLDDTGNVFEWHVRDVLAVSFFQRSVIQYEEKVVESMENVEREANEVEVDCTDISTEDKRESYDNYLVNFPFICILSKTS